MPQGVVSGREIMRSLNGPPATWADTNDKGDLGVRVQAVPEESEVSLERVKED